jgi:signal transduction histidine kinase
MDPHENDWSHKSDRLKQSQMNTRMTGQNQDLENNYLRLSSKLDLLKKRIENLKHDLRNPLFGITGMLTLMNIEDKDQIIVQTRDLIMIKESAESLLNLINGALVIQDTNTNLKESVDINRNLSSLITEIKRLYLPVAQNKSISLSLKSQIKTEIQLQPNFFINLIQIIGNLVANSIKFTPPKGSVDVIFSLDADKNHNTLNMTVIDSGKGMAPDQVSAFNQDKPIRKSLGTNGEPGFGIGLQHIKQRVSEYAGRIFLESEKDSGTTFSISFPIPDKNSDRKNGAYSIVNNGALNHE